MKRHLEAQCLSGFEVYHKLELDAQLYGKVGWLGALENFPGVGPYLLKHIHDGYPITHQATNLSTCSE